MGTDGMHDRGAWVRHGREGGPSYARLAPSVDRSWVEDFVLEQRLIGVPGERIGDALAVVESHVAESGEAVDEAFGDARAYARRSASGRGVAARIEPQWLVFLGLGLTGMLLGSHAAGEWLFGGGTVQVTLGGALTGVLVAGAFGVLAAAPSPVLRLAVRRPWSFMGLWVVLTLVMVVVNLVLTFPLATWPAGVVTGIGAALLAAGAVGTWLHQVRDPAGDAIVGPGSAVPRSAGEHVLAWLAVLLFPLLTVLMVGLDWLVLRLS